MKNKEITFPKDRNGKTVKVGDKVKGFGYLEYQNNFKTDRTPVVTVEVHNDILYFGRLSAKSFPSFEIVEEGSKQ